MNLALNILAVQLPIYCIFWPRKMIVWLPSQSFSINLNLKTHLFDVKKTKNFFISVKYNNRRKNCKFAKEDVSPHAFDVHPLVVLVTIYNSSLFR